MESKLEPMIEVTDLNLYYGSFQAVSYTHLRRDAAGARRLLLR